MLKRKTAKKIQKPIDYDIHLKYRCKNCSQDHWLSYLESCTKNFKVVCDCGFVFKVKRIVGFNLKYEKDSENKSIPKDRNKRIDNDIKLSDTKDQRETEADNSISIPENLLQSSVSILSSFGYSSIEAHDMVKDSYSKFKTDSVGDLVKFALANCK